MPPAVSRPWLVTLRSTIKSTTPMRIRITPITGDITIIGTAPLGRSIDIRMTVASSLEMIVSHTTTTTHSMNVFRRIACLGLPEGRQRARRAVLR